MSSSELSKGSGMAEGTVKCLVSYVEADTQLIQKKEKKGAQEQKALPRCYI